MATEQDYKILRVEEESVTKAVNRFNSEANSRYYPIHVLEDNNDKGVTTVLMSQGVNVLNTRHPDIVNLHFNKEFNTSNEDFILVDIDDLTRYPHFNSNYIDLEAIRISVDTTSNANYAISIGFLDNVGATDAQFIEIFRASAKNSAGATVNSGRLFTYGGGILTPAKWVSSDQGNLTGFANTVQLGSTLDPDTADTVPDDSDLAMRIIRGNTEQLNVAVTISYKTA